MSKGKKDHNEDDPNIVNSMDLPDPEDPVEEPEVEPEEDEDLEEPDDKPKRSPEEQAAYESLSEDERRLLDDEDAHFVKGKYRVPVDRINKLTGKLKDQAREVEALKIALQAKKSLRERAPAEEDKPLSREEIAELWNQDPIEAQRRIARQDRLEAEEQNRRDESQAEAQAKWQQLILDGDRRAQEEFPQLNFNDREKFDGEFFRRCTERAVERGWLQPIPPDPKQGRNQWSYSYLNPAAYHWAAKEVNTEYAPPEKPNANGDGNKAAAERIREARAKKESMSPGGKKPKQSKSAAKLTREERRAAELAGISAETYLKYKKSMKGTEVTVE